MDTNLLKMKSQKCFHKKIVSKNLHYDSEKAK